MARRLTPQEASVLALLLADAPAVVSREAIERKLWPSKPPDDSNQRINDLIQRVRAVFGDSPQDPAFIERIPGVGYRFVGTVELPTQAARGEPSATELALVLSNDGDREIADRPRPQVAGSFSQDTIASISAQITIDAATADGVARGWRGNRRLILILATIGIAFVAVAFLDLPWRGASPVESRRLISNSSERRIVTAAISPDAKYLAYADEVEAYMFEINSKQTFHLPLPPGETAQYISWFPNSTKLLVVTGDRSAERTDLHEVSIMIGGSPGPTLESDVGEAIVSHDNARIAYTNRTGRSLYVQQLGDSERRLLLTAGEDEVFRNLSWTGNGKLVFGRVRFGGSAYTVSIELVDTVTRTVTRLVTDARVSSGCATQDGALLFSRIDSDGSEILAGEIDLTSGLLRGSPHTLKRSRLTAIYMVSASTDARKIAYMEGPYQADAFTARLERHPRPELQDPQRLTLEESNDLPTAWKRDGDGVVFHSDRTGSWQVFAQEIGANRAEVIIDGPDDYKGARFTSDGKWLLFLAYPRFAKSQSSLLKGLQALRANLQVQVVRIPASGGLRQTLMEGAGLSFRCPSGRASYCVVCQTGLTGEMTFSELSPETGQISRMKSVRGLGSAYWDVSPDGRQLAIGAARGSDGLILRINIQDGSRQDIVVKDRPNLQSMDWMPDGNGWLVSSRWAFGAELLFVDPEGSQTVLRRQPFSFETWGLPYSDGRRIAFLEWSAAGSPWLLTR